MWWMKKDGFINIMNLQKKYNIQDNYLEYFGYVQAINTYLKNSDYY